MDSGMFFKLCAGGTPQEVQTALELLLKNGADVNARNKDDVTVLGLALLYHSSPEIFELLLKYGADVNVPDKFGVRVLDLAEYGNPEVVDLLMKYGAEGWRRTL